MIKSCQKTSAEIGTPGTNYSICMEQTSFIISNCETQSGKTKLAQWKCRILHALDKLSKKRARKLTFVVQAKVTFHTIMSSISHHKLLVVFGPSTLNSNQTNHKLYKKLANQKHWHMSLRHCGIQTWKCALIHRRSKEKVKSVWDAGKGF